MPQAKVIWLTGVSGAGKSTLAKYAHQWFLDNGKPVFLLDGDEIRDFFEGDLGYTREERIMNVRRVTFGAYLLAKNDINVVVANIAPYYEVRDFVRRKLGEHYIQVYVKASLDTVMKRDVKGLYKKHLAGENQNMVGSDDAYDEPRNPDLIIETDTASLDESERQLSDFLKRVLGGS